MDQRAPLSSGCGQMATRVTEPLTLLPPLPGASQRGRHCRGTRSVVFLHPRGGLRNPLRKVGPGAGLSAGWGTLSPQRRGPRPLLPLSGQAGPPMLRRGRKAPRELGQCHVAPPALGPSDVPLPQPAPEPLKRRHGAVVVGGGPAGLAAALALAKLRGWDDITVVEKAAPVSTAGAASYTYGIDGRGRRVVRALGLERELEERGIASTSLRRIAVQPDGGTRVLLPPVGDLKRSSILLPRSEFLNILFKGVEDYNEGEGHTEVGAGTAVAVELSKDVDDGDALAGNMAPADGGMAPAHNEKAHTREKVRVLTSSTVTRIERVPGCEGEGERLAVVIKTGRGGEEGEGEEREEVLYPSLVLGCDGINSMVRRTLETWAAEGAGMNCSSRATIDHEAAEENLSLFNAVWNGFRAALKRMHLSSETVRGSPPTFSLRRYPSPSSGLRFKSLMFRPNPVTRSGLVLENSGNFSLVGSYKGRLVFFGMAPLLSEEARFATTVLLPDHPFWDVPLGDVAAHRAVLAETFPQMDFDTQVPEEAMAAFANSRGGVFPVSQSSDGVAFVLPAVREDTAKTSLNTKLPTQSGNVSSAVILLGDSAHAFPPDIGQGVNAALLDVLALTQLLQEHSDDVAAAAHAYEAVQGPESDAIARLAPVAAPYQYRQVYWPAKFFNESRNLRLRLSKALGPALIAPPLSVMSVQPELSYSEILKRADATTRRIVASVFLLVLAAAVVVGKVING